MIDMLIFDPLLLLFWALFALVGLAAAQRKGFPPVAGVIGGLLLGPLAVLMFLISPSKRKCPHCAEWVKKDARVCPHCQRDLIEPAMSGTVRTSSARRK